MQTITRRIVEHLHRDAQLLRWIFTVSDYEWFELFSAGVMIVLSLIVLNPTSDVFSNGAAYEILQRVITEDAYGATLLFIGLCGYFALRSGSAWFRAVVMGVQALFWTLLFAAFVGASSNVFFPFFLCVFAVFNGAAFARDILAARANKIPPWTLP